MANRVFFTFHYQDVINFRANVVRNHWLTKPDREAAGFYDASIWEKAKKQGDIALKRLINGGLENTSNTCILIGSDTYARPWVDTKFSRASGVEITCSASTLIRLRARTGSLNGPVRILSNSSA